MGIHTNKIILGWQSVSACKRTGPWSLVSRRRAATPSTGWSSIRFATSRRNSRRSNTSEPWTPRPSSPPSKPNSSKPMNSTKKYTKIRNSPGTTNRSSSRTISPTRGLTICSSWPLCSQWGRGFRGRTSARKSASSSTMRSTLRFSELFKIRKDNFPMKSFQFITISLSFWKNRATTLNVGTTSAISQKSMKE